MSEAKNASVSEAKKDGTQPEAAPIDDKPVAVPAVPGDKEIGGRGGPDPVRYGDWEKGGIAVDF